MSEMIERMAKAYINDVQGLGWDEIGPHYQKQITERMRAVLEAMREPSEEMVEAGRTAEGEFPNGCNVTLKTRYQAMIDAVTASSDADL